MNWQDHIEQNPRIMGGKPCFKGTRITVEYILERLGQDAATQEVLQEYEGLTARHVTAALAYVAVK